MEPYLAWIAAGFTLVIVELITGTFYLLVIGLGAFAAAAVAFAGGGFLAQAVGGCAVALAGTWFVRRWHARNQKDSTTANLLDLGQPVVLEAWTDAASGRARVQYRGTTWDAKVATGTLAEPGGTLFITGQDGSTLLVGAPPSPT